MLLATNTGITKIFFGQEILTFSHNFRCNLQELLKKGWVAFSVIYLPEAVLAVGDGTYFYGFLVEKQPKPDILKEAS